MPSTIQRKITEAVEPSAVEVKSVELTIVTDPDTGKVLERLLEVRVAHDEEAINAAEAELVARSRTAPTN